jgi:hypothetical protein
MRWFLFSGAVALVAAGCGSGGSTSAEEIQHAASKTSEAGSLEADFAVDGQGLTGTGNGVFNNKQGSGRLKMQLVAAGRKVPFDSIVDGNTLYLRSPAFSQATTHDKQWVKLNVAALSSSSGGQGGSDLSGILDAAPTPANALAYLQGSLTVDKVGSEPVEGVPTTHYAVNVDLDQAAENTTGDARETVRRVIAQSGVKELPFDVWLDGNGYIRKVRYDEHAGRRQAAEVTMELHDFGAPVPITAPPVESVVDLTKMIG